MHFAHILAFIAPTLAFTVPVGQADGVYEVSYVSGQELHRLVRKINAIGAKEHPARDINVLAKRDPACGGDALNHADTDSANAELDQQCGGGARVSPGRDFYSIVGCTVAYFCNFDGNTRICTAGNRQAASRQITQTCGLYNSGWTQGPESYGYEDFCKAPGSNFCGRGRNGK